ncbi:MAG: acetoacetate decarboxylase family protein [Gammaproteobacteria bacterium]|nr:acetoacetate decarboxylase family protein [Gammaproteobacteria bacterium]
MGFVKTPEEIERIQSTLAEAEFMSAKLLAVQYLTKPDIVAHVLPPGLEPTDEPIATLLMGHWGRSNVCHAFSGACFYVQARHGEHVGDYCLAMQMSSDAAIIFGRDTFGEPKKYAITKLDRKGDTLVGSVTRYGQTIIQTEAVMETPVANPPSGFTNFHYKFLPKCDGQGLEWDPILVMATFKVMNAKVESGTATLKLANTPLDPLGEIEIVEMLGASYTEADTTARCTELARIDAKEFMPYAYSKFDDYDIMNNVSEEPWQPVRVA